MSRILGIGTSSPALSVALFEDGELIAHDYRLIGRGHAECLVPAIAVLPNHGRADAIIVDIGPGSFTGIRVGIAAARALGLAWGVPVCGVSASMVVAAQAFAASPELSEVTVLLDAGRGQVLVQTVNADFTVGPVRICMPSDAAASGDVFAGAGALLLPLGAGAHALHTGQPDLAHVLSVGVEARSLPPSAVYVRPPDAVLPI